MYKGNSTHPLIPFFEGSRQRKYSLPEIRYSKTSQDSISISWEDVLPLDGRQSMYTRSISEGGNEMRVKESYLKRKSNLSDPSAGTEKNRQNFNGAFCTDALGKTKLSSSDVSAETYQQCFNDDNMTMAIDLDEDKDELSPSDSDGNVFAMTADTFVKRKGMAKGHYEDKSLRKNCKACQKPFKLKRKPRHCRRCGEVFCLKCVSYKRKLNSLAHPDPEGKLRKVCKACFGEDVLVLGNVRSLTDDFISERTFAKHARMLHNRVNSLTTTFWPDQIDRRAECMRLITGFQQEVRQGGSLDVLRMKLKTPAWQKSRYWNIEIQAPVCRSCKGDVGLRKSSGNCRVCGLALCRKCSFKELLLYCETENTNLEAKIAVINTPGSPILEPNISILLYVCTDCKAYICDKQASDPLWYNCGMKKCIIRDVKNKNPIFENFKMTTETSVTKVETLLDTTDNDGSTLSSSKQKAKNEITVLRATLNDYGHELRVVRSWLQRNLTKTERTLLHNYVKCQHDTFIEYRYKCRALGNKIEGVGQRVNE